MMKNIWIITAMVAALFMGCSHNDRQELKQEGLEATGQSMESFEERRSDFIEKADNRLSYLDEQITKAKKNGTDTEKTEDAEELLSESRDKLKDLKSTSAEDFEENRQEFTSKLNELDQNVSNL